MKIAREMCDFGYSDPLHHARVARAFAVNNIGGARNAVTIAPTELEVMERNLISFKGAKAPAPFVTFGAVHESKIVDPETRHNGKVQKSLRIFPGAVDKARLCSLFGMVKKASYIAVPAWNGALQFSTKQESAEKKDFWDDGAASQTSGARVPSKYQSTPRKSRVARSAIMDGVPSFFDDFLSQVAKKGILGTNEKITVFDLREWYQGDKVDEKPLFGQILAKAPLLVDEEIPVESFVGVLYTAGYWMRDKELNLNLNILGVVLFMSRPADYRSSKNHPLRKKSKK
ncbi:hypothetical protein PsYK624_173420 [Phanerochaete sordida]|uniref:Uncharacterized protein n=1 Tax=Phanerochaete sordida TaxID=48140 RepID=A0A9P3LN88_9APHY|nr:hypothetical protein PsYK624_173420 [Phanerochaete sordida]